MELDDDHDDNIIEDDGENTLINDAFNVRMDDDQHPEIDDFDDLHDLPILEKAYKPLYEGFHISLLFVVFLIMNMKVLNGFLNTSITQMLRYVIICFIDRIYMITIKFIFVAIIFVLL